MAELNVFLRGRDEGARRELEKTGNALAKFGERASRTLGKLRDLTVVGTGVTRVFRSLARASVRTIETARKQELQEISLRAALEKTGKEAEKQLSVLKEWASQRQAVTTFGDEFTLSMAKIGAEFGLTTEQIIKGVEAVQDRAIQVGRAPIDMMRAFAKSVTGVSMQWTELGVVVDQTGTPLEKFNQAVAQMSSGVSELSARTPLAKFEQFGNLVGDLVEDIGRAVAHTTVFRVLLRALTDVIGDVRKFLDPTSDSFRKFDEILTKVFDVALGLAQAVIPAIVAAIQGLVFLVSTLNEALQSLATTFPFLGDAVDRVKMKLADSHFLTDLSSGARMAAEAIGWLRDQLAFTDEADALERLGEIGVNMLRGFAEAFQGGGGGGDVAKSIFAPFFDQEMEKLLIERANDIGEQFAGGFTNALNFALVDIFAGESASEAFANFGENARDMFVGTFSRGLLDPVNEIMKGAAQTLARPFTLIGQTIAQTFLQKPIEALANFVGSFLSQIASLFAEMLGISAANAAAGELVTAATAKATAAFWAPAAVAATIATLGSAAAQAPASIAAALAAGSAEFLVGYAEGGTVDPSPGGTPIIVGEGGEAEHIVPESKADAFALGRMGGSGGVTVNVRIENVNASDPNDLEALGDMVGNEVRNVLYGGFV